MDSSGLYQIAEESGIPIFRFRLPETESVSIQTEDGTCCIGIDEKVLETESNRKVHLAHEIGHCCTGSFYSRYAARDVRQQHENRANKWAIRTLIPKEKLDEAVADGYTEIWSLAEYFEVTEDFMRKAICLYVHGNMAVDLYF